MKRLLVLLCIAGFCLSGSQAPNPSNRMKQIEDGAEMEFKDVSPLLATLKISDQASLVSALRFWADHGHDAPQLYWDEGVDDSEFTRSLIETIAGLAESPSPSMRREAIRALCALSRHCGRCGTGYAESLGGRAYYALLKLPISAHSVLRDLSSDPNANVVDFAFGALSDEERARMQPNIRALLSSSDAKWQGIGICWFQASSPEDAMQALCPVLDGGDMSLVGRIAEALLQAKVDPARFLTNGRPYSEATRSVLLSMIGSSSKAADAKIVNPYLGDPSPKVRAAALEKMRELEAPVPELILRRALADIDPDGRSCALSMLAKTQVSDLPALVAKACDDPDDDTRASALWQAAQMHDRSLIEPMLKAVARGTDCDYVVCSVLTAPANAAYLERCVASPNVNLRRIAALALMDEDEAVSHIPQLKRLAADSDPRVIDFVTSGLVRSHDPSAIALLPEIAERGPNANLVSAIEAMGESKLPTFIDFVSKYVAAKDKAVRLVAKSALAALKEAAAPPQ